MRAHFVFSEIWVGLRRNLTMTVALIVTVAIAMALLGTGLLIKAQVDGMRDFWSGKVEVSVFLCNQTSNSAACQQTGAATQQQKDLIQADLNKLPEVASVTYESHATAYQHFKDSFKDTPQFTNAVQPQDLPDSFRVKLKDPSKFQVVASAVKGRPGVDSVLNEQDVLNRFFRILNGLKWASIGIALIQIIAAVLLIANTIRLAAYNRRRETGIMRLVGASNIYIQLPFLLEGAIAGLIGGIFASGLLVVAKITLFNKLQSYFTLAVQLGWGQLVQVIVVAITAGVLLCALASFVTLRRYLRI